MHKTEPMELTRHLLSHPMLLPTSERVRGRVLPLWLARLQLHLKERRCPPQSSIKQTRRTVTALLPCLTSRYSGYVMYYPFDVEVSRRFVIHPGAPFLQGNVHSRSAHSPCIATGRLGPLLASRRMGLSGHSLLSISLLEVL